MNATDLVHATRTRYEFYPERRAVNPVNGYCRYLTEDGRQRAIGCHLSYYDSSIEDTTASKLPKSYMPPWMEAMGGGFLDDVQNFHDAPENWSASSGLTNRGEEAFAKLLILARMEDARLQPGLETPEEVELDRDFIDHVRNEGNPFGASAAELAREDAAEIRAEQDRDDRLTER